MINATRCIHCGSFVSRNISFTKKGAPTWTCPVCGVTRKDRRWYKFVGQKEATEIIEHRGRRGLFVQKTGGKYIGIDNSTGDALVEEFLNLTECLMWLAGEKEVSQ